MAGTTANVVRRARVRVEGTVQGVGFRPYVFALARQLSVMGFVGNDGQGVLIEVEGAPTLVDRFLERLPSDVPPLAVIDRISAEEVAPRGGRGFAIVASTGNGGRQTLVSPDVATCPDCLAELQDPADRRHGHAFVNCTNCGPRFSIVRDVPYDRATTTMAGFELCPACTREYLDPGDRRFHAQPVCCPDCGPTLEFRVAGGRLRGGDAIGAAVQQLRDGAVLAVKGLGGYHLAADATNHDASAALRQRKHREDKPFAVMVADPAAARALCEVGDVEAALLDSPARPIVLLRRREGVTGVAPAVAPANRRLGVLLAYTPLHRLLADRSQRPLVLTSGNVSDEPIAYRDDDALERLAGIADGFLLHDREIHTRVDDSIAHVVGDRPTVLRRSRGYVPRPVALSSGLRRPVLACGAELKNTVCLARGQQAFLSHHIGDLQNYETFRSFQEAVEHLGRLFGIAPEVVAHDLHPDYLSTRHAHEAPELEGLHRVGVQHHHAHIASCLADNREEGPVIGLALDGTGWGTDGTVWGGEVLVADLADFERVGHLGTVPMPGGERAIHEPWRMAAAHLDAAFDGAVPAALDVVQRNAERWDDVLTVARSGVNSPMTSSAGRLFDAVSALLGVRDRITYEGQAAVELEQLTDPREQAGYDVAIDDGAPLRLAAEVLVRGIVDDLQCGVPVERIAARFHNAMAQLMVAACERVRDLHGLDVVALSGGVFQNALLSERTVAALELAGFRALTHRQIPPNDGGISLGQVVVAGARDRSV